MISIYSWMPSMASLVWVAVLKSDILSTFPQQTAHANERGVTTSTYCAFNYLRLLAGGGGLKHTVFIAVFVCHFVCL